MDKRTAREKLKDLRDSLSQVLGSKDSSSSEEIKEQAQESLEQARKASKALKKSFVDRVKELPVVQKVSELGTAGTVAISTATVAQTELAIDQTEVFVANIANDIVEERFEIPEVFNTFVNFETLNTWGQAKLQEKIVEAQQIIEEAEVKVSLNDKKPTSSQSPSDDSTSDENEKKESKEEKEETKEKESKEKEEIKEKKSSTEKDKSEKDQEEKENKEEEDKKIPLEEDKEEDKKEVKEEKKGFFESLFGGDEEVERVPTPDDATVQSPYI